MSRSSRNSREQNGRKLLLSYNIRTPHGELNYMRDQPPPGEVEGAKLEVASTELRGTGQKAGKNRAILTMGSNSLCHQGAGPTRRKLKKLLISHVTGQLCMLWEFTILSCTRSNNEPSATRMNYMWWYMWSISNSHIIPYNLNRLRKTDLSVRIWIIVVLWRGGFSPFVAQRPAWRNHCSQVTQLSDINKDSFWETKKSHSEIALKFKIKRYSNIMFLNLPKIYDVCLMVAIKKCHSILLFAWLSIQSWLDFLSTYTESTYMAEFKKDLRP